MKKTLQLLLLLFSGGMLQAQSYHFSQFFSTPLLTNPAHTGYMNGPYRAAANFRAQGNSSSPIFTGYLSFDISPLKEVLQDGHKAGLGLYVMNDRAMNGALQTNSVGLSAAYHIGLDAYGDYSLGLGFQGAYHQKRFDMAKLRFENQYGGGGFDPSLPVGEAFDYNHQNYFDANAGIVYNANLEDKSFFAGIAVYNILRHKENYLPDEFKMPARLVVQAGSQLFMGENSKAYLSATHVSQAKARETTLGAAYGLQVGDRDIKNEINLGMWYRLKDAVIPYLGYHYEGFQVGLSYDYTVSSLKAGAAVRNAYELTLLYSAIDKSRLKTLIPWY
ncbi:MAG: PorP/SprF family type IX secretion system membrane protein [Chitinophagaceae bacterium]